MKLRNKKTGESGELHYYPDKAYHFAVSAKDPTQTGIYKTLGELLQDWTDFIVHVPTEPLIKDEKIRKAVRAWAEANEAIEFSLRYDNKRIGFYSARADSVIEFATDVDILSEHGCFYTITELCGDEE